MKVASFTYYGETEDKNREVHLHRNPNGTYTIDIEGMPSLARTVSDKDEAEDILRGWWEMSQKDWGASEIIWEAGYDINSN